jgi:hypothetical protein
MIIVITMVNVQLFVRIFHVVHLIVHEQVVLMVLNAIQLMIMYVNQIPVLTVIVLRE